MSVANTETATEEQAVFFRAELARTPRTFETLTVDQMDVELDARWLAHQNKGNTFLWDFKVSEEEARKNGVIYCGTINRDGTDQYMYKATLVAAASKKRKSEGGETSSTANLELVFTHFKKDTLQSMCEDLDIPVSGNKPELISRIVNAMTCGTK